MKDDKLADAASPNAIAKYLAKRPMSMPHHRAGRVESVRQAAYKGHRIEIRTTYRVEVDNRVLDLPLGVDNDGHVHCHSLPNYQFTSAIDMVKQLIDSFPADFSRGRKRRTAPSLQAGHGRMQMPMRSRASRRR
jgi:hypothetical protein